MQQARRSSGTVVTFVEGSPVFRESGHAQPRREQSSAKMDGVFGVGGYIPKALPSTRIRILDIGWRFGSGPNVVCVGGVFAGRPLSRSGTFETLLGLWTHVISDPRPGLAALQLDKPHQFMLDTRTWQLAEKQLVSFFGVKPREDWVVPLVAESGTVQEPAK